MDPDDLPALVNAVAPATVAVGFVVTLIRVVRNVLPFPLRFIAWAVGIVLVFAVADVAATFAAESPEVFAVGWLGLGLVVFLVWRWRATAEARAKRDDRLRQARGHERRRAQPPIPGGHGHHHGGPRPPTTGTTT